MRRLCIAAVLAFVLAPAAAPAQAADWDGTQTLAKNPQPVAVAGNEHGRRVVAWAHTGGVFARVAPRGARFGPRIRIAGPPHKSEVRVAIDERGNIAFVWSYFVDADPDRDPDIEQPDGFSPCCSRLMSAVLRPDGRLSRRVEVGVPDAINGAALLSSDAKGHLGLAFETFDEIGDDGANYARFGTMRRGFAPLQSMSPPGENGTPVSVGRGRLIYSSSRFPPQTVETSRSAGGELRRRVLLGFPIDATQLGTDDKGRQTAAFENGATATRTPPGPFQTVDEHDAGSRPLVGVAGSGAALVAWTADTKLMAQVRPPGADFGPPLELDRVEGDELILGSPDAARDGSAAVAMVTRHRQEPDPVLQSRVYVVPADEGGPVERLVLDTNAPGVEVHVQHDARGTLAVAAGSDGVVAHWLR